MSSLDLRPTHKSVQHYYAALRRFDDLPREARKEFDLGYPGDNKDRTT